MPSSTRRSPSSRIDFKPAAWAAAAIFASAAAQAAGLKSMREDGERLVEEGITSLEEVVRVTRE